MLCQNPYRGQGGLEHGCGRCNVCRINKRREWTARALLESLGHTESSFLTLTYTEASYPADGSVSKREMQMFIKRLRWTSTNVRYMVVGEYGSRTWRAHYHALLFGLSPLVAQDLVSSAWSKGYIQVGSLTPQSAQYLCGYTLKKMTNKLDPRLEGRKPEFMLSSRRPGIGMAAFDILVEAHYTAAGARYLAQHHDVMRQARIGNKIYPIGRYLTAKLREALGLPPSHPKRLEVMLEDMEAIKSLPDLWEAREDLRIAHGRKALNMVSRNGKTL